MRVFASILVLVAVFTAGCGLFGGGDANSNVNANTPQPDDPSAVPEFKSAGEAIAKGDDYLDDSLYKMAINAFRQATELDPDSGEAHFKLGVAYSLDEKETGSAPIGTENKNSDISFKNAIKVYKSHLKDNPDDAEARFNLGRAHGKLFEDKEAADEIGKAVKLNEENGLYQTEYGAALIKLARYNEAIKALEKALELDKDNLQAEDLLEKARAGKRREDYRAPKEKSDSNSNTDEKEEDSQSSPEKNIPPPPPMPDKPPAAPSPAGRE